MLRHGILIIAVGLLTACSPLPGRKRRVTRHHGARKRADPAGAKPGAATERPSGRLGVVPLHDPLDAFAARMHLISTAQRSLDLQYYIWRDDITGNLLLQALHEAAQRNVRVRLLIDDNGTSGLDAKLALLNAEPNAEVRLFNPFPFRTFKPLGFLLDFKRLNRRMHNKSLTADGQVTIVGGRNIGDEYFGATPDIAFTDLDVLVAGRVVGDVSQDFDRYWNSEPADPLEHRVTMPSQRTARSLQRAEARAARTPQAHLYDEAARKSTFIEHLLVRTLDFHWVPVRMVSDSPDKVLGRVPPGDTLAARLKSLLEKPRQSVDLISPYFIPTQQGAEAFASLAQQGVRLCVLTNALAATDVTAVHAGYAQYRQPLLEHGVTLFEMRREATPGRPKEKAGPFGSSGSSLHAKTFAVDGKRVFVGSFNFDPRSALLNTELGFVIESEAMAQAMSDAFDRKIPEEAYRLELDDKGDLVWLEQHAGQTQVWTTEPDSTFWKRLYVGALSLLPIEPLL